MPRVGLDHKGNLTGLHGVVEHGVVERDDLWNAADQYSVFYSTASLDERPIPIDPTESFPEAATDLISNPPEPRTARVRKPGLMLVTSHFVIDSDNRALEVSRRIKNISNPPLLIQIHRVTMQVRQCRKIK